MAVVGKVLIVGGGIAGLAAAIAFRRSGIAVDLVELKTDWTVYGVGIIQQANVVRAMAQLGVVDRYLAMSYSFDDVGIYTPDGQRIALIPGPRLAGPAYPANLGISRPALHEILTSEAQLLGCSVRLGTSIESVADHGTDVDVVLTDGSSARYDLVVGADGIYSKVRGMLFADAPQPAFTGQAVWRYNFERRPEIDHLATFHGPHGAAGLVPLSDDMMYMFVTSAEPGNPRLPPEELATLMRDRMKPFSGLIGELREQITDASKVVYKPIETLLVPNPWFKGRVVLIGDAAHSSTPHLGQGAGLAIEDAIVLNQVMVADSSVEQALTHFMERRFERVKYVLEASASIGEAQMRHERINEPQIVREMLERTAAPI